VRVKEDRRRRGATRRDFMLGWCGLIVVEEILGLSREA
jgi:hypothetical protein